MDNEYYEMYYRDEAGDLIYCGDLDSKEQAEFMCERLGWEFPKHDYFYETVNRENQ